MTPAFSPLAEDINQETGLIWKIWIENPNTQ
ncbi:YdhR family protein [Acinetobacter sp. A7.4]|nr:YdhR family protein [Acinetobacter sp. A7.4]